MDYRYAARRFVSRHLLRVSLGGARQELAVEKPAHEGGASPREPREGDVQQNQAEDRHDAAGDTTVKSCHYYDFPRVNLMPCNFAESTPRAAFSNGSPDGQGSYLW